MPYRLLVALVLGLFVVSVNPAAGAAPADTLAGRVEVMSVESDVYDAPREVAVYLPPGYPSEGPYPVVYAFTRSFFFDVVGLPAWLDAAVAGGLPPVVVVGIDAADLEEHALDTEAAARLQRFAVAAVVPAVEARYAVAAEAARRGATGFSSGANIAVDAAVRHPGVFGRVAALSPGWMTITPAGTRTIDFTETALRHIDTAPAGAPAAMWFVWGDETDLDARGGLWEHRSRENGRRVLRALQAKGAVVEAAYRPGAHTLDLYRSVVGEGFAFLVGAAGS